MPEKVIAWDELFLAFKKNVFLDMAQHLANDLGVKVESINRLEVGFYPGEQAWIFTERDHTGKIIGLQRRFMDGKKFMVEGSKRGLVYETKCVERFGEEQKDSCHSTRFVRAYSAGVDCPLCGKRKWCLVSDDNPNNPSAVICGHTREGAAKYIENSGYLHHLKPRGNNLQTGVLSDSHTPILVVEGASDVLAALDMGYIAIGKPAAEAGHEELVELLKGKDVVVIGENDEAGRRGMLKTYGILRAACKGVQKVLPPVKYKDLRAWHPTADEFEKWLAEESEKVDNDSVIELVDYLKLTEQWLKAQPDRLILHLGNWYKHNGICYEQADVNWLRNQIRGFFRLMEIRKHSGKVDSIEKLTIDKKFVDEVQDVLRSGCSIQVPKYVTEPFYIGKRINLDISKSVIFLNGIYDVIADKMEPLTSEVFITSTLPHRYEPKAKAPVWLWAVNDWFNSDQQCINLLQEWFGYNLIANNYLQQMLFLYGVPGSGKSTTIDTLRAMLGPDRSVAADVESFTSSFGMQPLIGKYAAIISESEATSRRQAKQALEKIKQITGGDTIKVNQKYKDTLDIKLFCRITYASNDLPAFQDEPQALFRRFNLLYYGNHYAKPDRALGLKIAKEAPGIINWALEGLRRLLERGDFTKPTASEEHIVDCKALASPIRTMVNMWCEFDPKAEVPVNYLYELHQAVAQENGEQPDTRVSFGRKLSNAFPSQIRKVQKRVNGERVYVYEGICIVPEAYKNFLGRP